MQIYQEDVAAIRAELVAGLVASQPYVSPKYLYDALGARLFEAITELPEYTPTRQEAEIFGRSMPEIVGGLPTGSCLIDLGAGSCRKAARVIPVLKPVQYLAVDISVEFMGNCLEALRREFPGLAVEGLGIDFSQGLSADAIQAMVPSDRPRVYFYPGSSIGNFHPAEAEAFLRGLICDGGAQGLVIGVDMVKDVSALELAYDDPLGVTAAFNRNMLLHLNKRLTANFDIRDWDHRAVFNVAESRIEMHLVAQRDLSVRWPDASRSFAKGQWIHTENSYKYTVASFSALLGRAGYAVAGVFQDSHKGFAVFVARP
ncbi:MAG: L-histidine N(alpha)-methyltransferase [Burkholderiaceae bacterium]|jgi:dimethylhistidine N-methyltransferase